MKQLSFLLLLLFAFRAGAEGLSLETSTEEKTSFLAFSLDYGRFTLPEGSIVGYGGQLDFTHFFSSSISVDAYFSSALGNDGGISSTFTGFGGYINYLVLGQCCSARHTVSVAGFPTVTETEKLGNLLQLGVGVDQYFLNGTQSVYPASGLGIQASYDFNLIGKRLRVAGRDSFMTANKVKVQGLFFSVGLVFPL